MLKVCCDVERGKILFPTIPMEELVDHADGRGPRCLWAQSDFRQQTVPA
jgi:hypothetical protein